MKKALKKKGVVNKGEKHRVGRVKSKRAELVPEHETEVYLKRIFELYGIWKHLPPVMRKMSDEDLQVRFGIDNSEIYELLQIHSQRAFAEKYKLHENTVSRWNAKLEQTSAMEWIRKWAKGMVKNVMLHAYQNATSKSGTAFIDRQFILKSVDQWEEKSTVKIEGYGDALVAALKAKRASRNTITP